MNQESDKNKPTQKDKFMETAFALGCDESESAFDTKLGKLAQHQPVPAKPKGKQNG